jgi:hypothetical protein
MTSLPLYLSGRNIHVKIKQVRIAVPKVKSRARWIGVPVSPDELQAHGLALASKKTLKAQEMDSGTMLIAGFTLPEVIPEIKRNRNSSG